MCGSVSDGKEGTSDTPEYYTGSKQPVLTIVLSLRRSSHNSIDARGYIFSDPGPKQD